MRKIIAVLALSAVMLTGCAEEKETEEIIKNSIIESSIVTAEETSAEEKSEETTIVTELATEKETTALTEQEKEQFRVVYTGDCWRIFNLENGIVCVQSEQLDFVNTYTGEVENSVSVPDDFSRPIDRVVKGSDDVLAKAICGEYDYSTTPPTYSADVLIVKDDYTCEAIYDGKPADASFEACGHNIAEWGLDIVYTDSGEIIVPGYEKEGDEYGFYTQWNEYKFDIDENRFVYRIGGYESLPGYGIYDFSTGTATTVPESRDLIPIGCHNGKIYSVKGAWDGWGSELYVTDLETLESEFFMDFPQKLTVNQIVDYSMPESGEFIVANKAYYSDDNGVYSAALYRINPDTAEIEAVIEIPDEYECYNQGYLIDESTFAVNCDKADATILIDLAWTEIDGDRAILDEFVETVRAAYNECVENESYDKLDEIEELSPIFHYGKANSDILGYCYLDLDGDGTEELLFGEDGAGEWNDVIYGIYTVRDGKVHCVEYGGERHRFFYCGNGVIENQGSAAAWYSYHKFYSYSDGKLELIEAVIHDAERSFDEPFFHMTAGQTEEEAVPISEEKALEIIESYDTVDVKFTTFVEAEEHPYKHALENILYNMIFPDGYSIPPENYDYEITENEFSVYDIDNDEEDELIFMFTESCMAGMFCCIYEYEDGGFNTQLSVFPSCRFYDNGVIEVDSSHNQHFYNGDFWPYSLYYYNKETDSYDGIAFVEAYDKETIEAVNEEFVSVGKEPFNYPEEIDVSNYGFVYIVQYPDGHTATVDVSEYNAWHGSWVGDAEKLELPFMKLTQENIDKTFEGLN